MRRAWLDEPGGIAEHLRRLRNAAGLTGESMAEQLDWPRTKISKLENGRQVPTVEDIRNWTRICDAPEAADELLAMLDKGLAVHRPYQHARRTGGQPALQRKLNDAVREGRSIRNFDLAVIPGLLQTPDYARYRSEEAVRNYGMDPDQVEASVTARMLRQNELGNSAHEFEFITTEAAFRLLVCPAPVMLGQVDRLLNVFGLPNVTFRIIPFDTVLPTAPMHGFLIVDDVTYIETHAAEDEIPPSESVQYGKIMDGFQAEAVTGDEARQILIRAADHLRGLVNNEESS